MFASLSNVFHISPDRDELLYSTTLKVRGCPAISQPIKIASDCLYLTMIISIAIVFALIVIFQFLGKLEMLIFAGVSVPVLLIYWLFKKRFAADDTGYDAILDPQNCDVPGNIFHKH